MVLPIYAGIQRLSPSLLGTAGDLGAKPFRTFRSVMLPLLPAVAAGSIFTFSLTLGDYIDAWLGEQREGQVHVRHAHQHRSGCAQSTARRCVHAGPLLIVVLYLLAMKRRRIREPVMRIMSTSA